MIKLNEYYKLIWLDFEPLTLIFFFAFMIE